MIEWKELAINRPEIGDFIIVSNDKIEDLRKGHFCICFPTPDRKDMHFQLESDQYDAPEKWKYWTQLLIELDAPDNASAGELDIFYEYCKFLLNSYEARFLLVAKSSVNASKNVYAMDSYISGIVSRSLSLTYGFTTLLDSKNFMAAAHLCRLHLDNYLRLYAAWIAPNPHDFAMAVLSGKRVEELKDRDGKPMRDWYLREKANKDKPWVTNVYKETSGYIHFSRKHIMSNSTVSKDKEGVIETYLSKYDHDNVKVSNRIEGVLGMIEISNAILEYIVGWVYTKMNEDKHKALKKK